MYSSVKVRATYSDKISARTRNELSKCSWQGRGMMSLKLEDGNKYPLFIARQAGKIVGWGMFTSMSRTRRNSFYIHVNPEYRRRGIGTKIFLRALEYNHKPYVYRTYNGSKFYDQFKDL